MHILVVNDDGPPSARLSPYIQPFVSALRAAGHRVSVAIPAASRSWIGKAHLIEAPLSATYVPESAFLNDGSWSDTPSSSSSSSTAEEKDQEEDQQWVVITNGTPASCVQLGLFNLFPSSNPIDLVISGPNHGRNASTIYNLSSGTVGGALEAANCGKRGIAISFGSKDPQPPAVIAAAARHSVRLVEHLCRNWDARVELYNLNVPMREDVESREVRYTTALPYYWQRGYLYKEKVDESKEEEEEEEKKVNGEVAVNGNGNGNAEEPPAKKLCNGVSSTTTTTATTNGVHPPSRLKKRDFTWAAELGDMKKALQLSPEGTDAQTVLSGNTSVTALRANFWHVPGLEGPLKLDDA